MLLYLDGSKLIADPLRLLPLRELAAVNLLNGGTKRSWQHADDRGWRTAEDDDADDDDDDEQ